MNKSNRIFILGTSGSGKTYLAKELSKRLNIQEYDLDDIFFSRKYDKPRSEKSREKMFTAICKKEKWVIEGVYSTWIDAGIKKSDLVIILDTPFHITSYRIFKRFLSRKGKHKETWKDIFTLLKFVKKYRKKSYDKGYYKHKEIIDKHKVEFVEIKNKKGLSKFLEELK